jgi:hypothetical protein
LFYLIYPRNFLTKVQAGTVENYQSNQGELILWQEQNKAARRLLLPTRLNTAKISTLVSAKWVANWAEPVAFTPTAT